MAKKILRLPDTEQKVGLKKTRIYELVEGRRFPAPVPLGLRAHGWLEDELDAWIEQQAKKRTGVRWKAEAAA